MHIQQQCVAIVEKLKLYWKRNSAVVLQNAVENF